MELESSSVHSICALYMRTWHLSWSYRYRSMQCWPWIHLLTQTGEAEWYQRLHHACKTVKFSCFWHRKLTVYAIQARKLVTRCVVHIRMQCKSSCIGARSLGCTVHSEVNPSKQGVSGFVLTEMHAQAETGVPGHSTSDT
jgi:hypothetical protein